MTTTSGMQVIAFAAAATPTPLHDGTNAAGFPVYLTEFTIQNNGGVDLFLGGPAVTGDTDGLTLGDGCSLKAIGPESRGETSEYDMRELYYVGGSFKLIYNRGL